MSRPSAADVGPARRQRWSIGAVTVIALLVAACGGAGTDAEDDGAAVTSTSAVAGDGGASLAANDLELELVANVANQPVMAMAVRPGDDDGVYLAIRPGYLLRLDLADPSGPEGVSPRLIDFNERVAHGGEGGFLGAAFSPDGRRFYASFTDQSGDSTLDEYQVSGSGADTTIDPDTRRRVLQVPREPDSFHNGGNIVFGPDGYLYVALGEGGGVVAGVDNGQDRTTLLGKILRIDPTGGATPYSAPADNPYVDGADGRPSIWITGVRNPWRYSFDRVTGDLWIGDVGETTVEEIDYLPASVDGLDAGRGANLGWAEMEGDEPFDGGSEPADHTGPLVTLLHEDGACAVIGGYVSRGPDLPSLEGSYLYVDRCLRRLQSVTVVDGRVVDEADLGEVPQGTVSFGEDAAGRLYLLQQSGDVLALGPVG